jgi:hypothetical protein
MARSKLDLARRVDGNIYGIVDAEEKRAGILQAPAHIGDAEIHVGGQPLSRQMRLNNDRERMTCPMHRKGSQNLDFKIPLRENLPLHLLRCEGDFRILRALQDVFVHLVVARMAAAVAARGVNHHQPAGVSRGGIELDRPALEFERPMNGMEDVAQSKAHLGLSGIEFQYRFLRDDRRCEREGKQRERQGERISPQRVGFGHGYVGPWIGIFNWGWRATSCPT